jgi:hypothetical protein
MNLDLISPNYSYINEINEIKEIKEIKEIDELDPDNIINTYNNLESLLNKYKKDFIKLEEQKDKFYNYKNNLTINHINIIEIYNNENENDKIKNISETFIKYDNNIKDLYYEWLNSYYNPIIKKLDKDIIDLEIKINNFRNLFILTINKFIKNPENLNKKICSICFDNEIDMCAYPCGHTCCNNCIYSSRININNKNRCLSCRNEIDTYIKIYFLI